MTNETETLQTHINTLCAEYKADAGLIVRALGKFESEHIVAVYLYDAMLNGDTADCVVDDEQWLVMLTDCEKEVLGLEADYVLMAETCSGFVTCTMLTKAQGDSIIENGEY